MSTVSAGVSPNIIPSPPQPQIKTLPQLSLWPSPFTPLFTFQIGIFFITYTYQFDYVLVGLTNIKMEDKYSFNNLKMVIKRQDQVTIVSLNTHFMGAINL